MKPTTYTVHRGDSLVGHLTREYHGPNAWPGVVGYTRGRIMYRFLADALPRNGDHPEHGFYYERLSEAKAALAPLVVRKIKIEQSL